MFFPWKTKKENVKSDKRDLHICKSAPSDAGWWGRPWPKSCVSQQYGNDLLNHRSWFVSKDLYLIGTLFVGDLVHEMGKIRFLTSSKLQSKWSYFYQALEASLLGRSHAESCRVGYASAEPRFYWTSGALCKMPPSSTLPQVDMKKTIQRKKGSSLRRLCRILNDNRLFSDGASSSFCHSIGYQLNPQLSTQGRYHTVNDVKTVALCPLLVKPDYKGL